MANCQHSKIAVMRVGSTAEVLTFEGDRLVKHDKVPVEETRRVVVRCLDCGVVRTYEASLKQAPPERITRLLEANPYSVDEKQVIDNMLRNLMSASGVGGYPLLPGNRLSLEPGKDGK